jgi:uncharacterized protein (DUF2147 family)
VRKTSPTRLQSRRIGRFAGILLAALAPGGALGADPYGVWLTGDRDAAVEIAPCGGNDWLLLCGRIVWLEDSTDDSGRPRVDSRNPDPARREQPICGLFVMDGLRLSGPDTWGGGSVYNPQDGRIYSADMKLLADTTLRVRAYLGVPFFGKTQIWTRAERSAAGLVEYNCLTVRVPPGVGSVRRPD